MTNSVASQAEADLHAAAAALNSKVPALVDKALLRRACAMSLYGLSDCGVTCSTWHTVRQVLGH